MQEETKGNKTLKIKTKEETNYKSTEAWKKEQKKKLTIGMKEETRKKRNF
jgi:hypothetical protein